MGVDIRDYDRAQKAGFVSAVRLIQAGGKPSTGTPADKRLKSNKKSKKR